MLKCSSLEIPQGPIVYFTGPPLEAGPFPAFFYFSLSGDASLTLDPYNQPVQFLSSYPVRVFSLTLPCHDHSSQFHTAIASWAREIENGHNVIEEFVSQTIQALDFLCDRDVIDAKKLAAGGLSRGGFIATHLAAKDPRIHQILAFAPLTKLTYSKDFLHLQNHPLAESLNLIHLAPQLLRKKLRFYIGNRDTLVGTSQCFDFITHLVEASNHAHIRSVPVDLIITASHGHAGHGTLTPTFKDGIHWLLDQWQMN